MPLQESVSREKEHRKTADFRAQGQNRCVRASSREFGVLFEAQEKKETEKRIEKRQCGSSASTGERVGVESMSKAVQCLSVPIH